LRQRFLCHWSSVSSELPPPSSVRRVRHINQYFVTSDVACLLQSSLSSVCSMMTSINLTANTTLFHTLLTVYIHTHSERAFSFLLVQSMRRSTLGDRSFPVAAARAWNALPQHVQNAPSLSVFRREMKTVLFRLSFPDVI